MQASLGGIVNNLLLKSCAALAAFLLVTANAQAVAIYAYTGTTFTNITDNNPPSGTYDTTMKISGSFQVDTAFGPMAVTDITGLITAFSFFDGRNLLTEANAEIATASISIDGSGNILNWTLFFSTPLPDPRFVGDELWSISTNNLIDNAAVTVCMAVALAGNCSVAQQDGGSTIVAPGTWTTLTAVPVPAAAWLFASALSFIGWLKRLAI